MCVSRLASVLFSEVKKKIQEIVPYQLIKVIMIVYFKLNFDQIEIT